MRYRYEVIATQRQGETALLPAHLQKSAGLKGLFEGRLGFASNEAAILWAADGPDPLFGFKYAVQRSTDKITAVARGGGKLKLGGIYVHRWFTIDAGAEAQFVELSKGAWPAFERDYDTEIFGLFAADRTGKDMTENATRMLLLTYYASHDVWEQSRNPTQEAFENFRKRHAITRHTIARSSFVSMTES